MQKLLIAFLILLCPNVLSAQSFDTTGARISEVSVVDSGTRNPIRFRSFLLPAGLIGYGVLSLHVPALQDFNQHVYDVTSAGPHSYERPYLEDFLLLTPAATVYGLNAFGVKGRNTVIDASILYAMSNLLSYGTSYSIKRLTNEQRPDGSDDHSFPSGHTTGAFVAAESLNQEYRGKVHWTVIAGGYVVAGSVGYLRLYHNKHWFGDVVAGAGIGMAGTKLCYLLYPHLKRWLRNDRSPSSNVMLIPTYSPGIYGLALIKRF